jgi:hypothetical protein
MCFILPRYGLGMPQVKKKIDELLEEEYFLISWFSAKPYPRLPLSLFKTS